MKHLIKWKYFIKQWCKSAFRWISPILLPKMSFL